MDSRNRSLKGNVIEDNRTGTHYWVDDTGYWHPFEDNELMITNEGLKIQEYKKNWSENNAFGGAANGDISGAGTMGTGWTAAASGGITKTVVGTGKQNNMDYCDVRFEGTVTSPTYAILVIPPGYSDVVAAEGEHWCGSIFLAHVDGTSANVTYLWYNFG